MKCKNNKKEMKEWKEITIVSARIKNIELKAFLINKSVKIYQV